MLKGVSAARRTDENPAASSTSRRRASPAWAPRQAASELDWARLAWVQMNAEAE